MPRAARLDVGGYPYHVINRAVMRLQIFSSASDYLLFKKILADVASEMGMRILAFCLMPNHWHLILHPANDGDLGLFMHRLTKMGTGTISRERSLLHFLKIGECLIPIQISGEQHGNGKDSEQQERS